MSAEAASGAPAAPRKPRKHRAQALDLIRAAAALSVLTYHVWLYRLPNPSAPSRHGVLDHTLFELRIGLVVFFVMSGYLLYRPLLADWRAAPRTVALRGYYWRRIARIVPAYYLAIATAIVLLWPLDGTPGVRLPPAHDLWLFLFFLQNYNPHTLLTLDAPTWTLAVQAAFYFVFPLLLVCGTRLGRRAWAAPVAFILLGLAWNWISYRNGWSAVARLALPAMMPYLAMGMLIAHLPPARTRAAAVGMIAAGAALALGNAVWHAAGSVGELGGVLRDVPGAVGYGLIIAACAQPAIGAARALRPFESFGRWSYGVFLFHLPVLLFLKGHGLMPASGVATWALLVALATAIGALVWRFVERPMLARSRGSG